MLWVSGIARKARQGRVVTRLELSGIGMDAALDVAKEFLLAEYSKYQQAFAKNDELGERRVQILLGISDGRSRSHAIPRDGRQRRDIETSDTVSIAWIACGLAVLLLAVGLLTYDRLLKRDESTTE